MLIGSYFKRPKAPIDLPNADGSRKLYYFTPVDRDNPDSEHVCEVVDPVHAQQLLGIKEGYYISQAQTAAVAAASIAATQRPPVPQPPSAPAPARPPVDPMDAGTTSIDSVVAGASEAFDASTSAKLASLKSDADKAEDLVELKLSELKAALPNQPRSVIEAALAIETGRAEDDQRPTFIKNLQNALKA